MNIKINRPYFIAEISANHKKSLSRALKLVKMAAKAGFDAVKLQTYEADKITLKSKKKDFQIKDKKSIPSALSFTCIALPGKRITGISECSFSVAKQTSKLSFVSKLPPTKK